MGKQVGRKKAYKLMCSQLLGAQAPPFTVSQNHSCAFRTRDKPRCGITTVLASSVRKGWNFSVTFRRVFSSDRLLTYSGYMMSQLDSNDPNYFEDYGTGQRRKVVSQGKENKKEECKAFQLFKMFPGQGYIVFSPVLIHLFSSRGQSLIGFLASL